MNASTFSQYSIAANFTNDSLIILYSIGVAVTLLISGAVYFFCRQSQWAISKTLLRLLIVAAGYLFFAQYFKYRSLHFYVDFSHWMQLLYTIVDTGFPHALNQEFIVPGSLNYFSVHFVPFIYILAMPFKLIPSPETVIVLNVVLMLSAAIPLYKLAFYMRKDRHFALLIAALLLWYPTFQYITLYEFEMLRFSIPILLWMLYFFETRRTLLYFLFAFLAIFVREEMGLTIAIFGIYAWFFQKRRREGLPSIFLGLGGFALITSVIMLMLRSGEYIHVAAGEFSKFGSSPFEIVVGVIRHPVVMFQMILNPLKLANLFMLGFPLLFVPLASPSALLGMMANVGTGLLSKSVIHTSYQLYYLAPSVPFIFYALLKAWPSLTLPSPLGRGVGVRIRGWVGGWGEKPLMNALLTAVIVSNIFFGPSPISLQFWFKDIRPAPFRTQDFHWSTYRVITHHQKVEEFVDLIPNDAIVSAPQFLHPRLYKKKGTMMFPKLQSQDGKWRAEYVLLDITNNGLKLESPAYVTQTEMAVVRENSEWKFMKADDGYELYRRHLFLKDDSL